DVVGEGVGAGEDHAGDGGEQGEEDGGGDRGEEEGLGGGHLRAERGLGAEQVGGVALRVDPGDRLPSDHGGRAEADHGEDEDEQGDGGDRPGQGVAHLAGVGGRVHVHGDEEEAGAAEDVGQV